MLSLSIVVVVVCRRRCLLTMRMVNETFTLMQLCFMNTLRLGLGPITICIQISDNLNVRTYNLFLQSGLWPITICVQLFLQSYLMSMPKALLNGVYNILNDTCNISQSSMSNTSPSQSSMSNATCNASTYILRSYPSILRAYFYCHAAAKTPTLTTIPPWTACDNASQ